jgi:hypothetical protein
LLARRRERRGEAPGSRRRTLDRLRKPIEGVLSVLTECFGVEPILARTDRGIDRRTQTKVIAFSLARTINRALELEPMDITRCAV